jgi:hypothetical protein
MEEFYRNRALNWGYISSITLLAIVGLLTIFDGNYTKFTGSVDLSDFSIKLVLVLVVAATYVTLVTPSIKVLGENNVLTKTPPRGDRGQRGNRGKLGSNSVCNECGDDLCYKKIMYTITKTINFWRQQNNIELLDDNYIIENEYIKDKAKKHCSSKEFRKLLNKYGSNNKRAIINPDDPESPICPKAISDLKTEYKDDGTNLGFGCGAYDFLLKMWSIWILIILRFKNGMLFLDSIGLNENDFVGMIVKEDSFKPGDSIKLDPASPDLFEVIDNTEFPFFTILHKTTNRTKTEYINKLYSAYDNLCANPNCDQESSVESGCALSWNHMFKQDVGNDTKERIIMLGQVMFNQEQNKYKMDGICNNFIKVIGNAPGGGKLSPFDEIKQYSAWYWGGEPSSKPRFVIEKQEENKVCPSCKNSYLCDLSASNQIKTGGIKVKFTNTYKQLADLSIFGSKKGGDGFFVPFSKLKDGDFIDRNKSKVGNSKPLNMTIFRPETLMDESEPHTYFKEYKPVGDVILNNDNFTLNSTDLAKCFPKEGLYNEDLLTPVIGVGNKSNVPITNSDSEIGPFLNHGHVYTMLVAGDTRPPEDFDLVARYVKNEGFKKNYEGISIWRPISQPGYVALGFVIDIRPFDPNNGSTKDIANKPPRDIIATVPVNSLKELQLNPNDRNSFKNLNFLTNVNKVTNINTFLGDVNVTDNDSLRATDPVLKNSCINNSLNDEIVCAYNDAKNGVICQSMTDIDKTEDININLDSKPKDPINALFKNKKYSIQKIYDNNNE